MGCLEMVGNQEWDPQMRLGLGSPGSQAVQSGDSGSGHPDACSPRLLRPGGRGRVGPSGSRGWGGRRHPAAWGRPAPLGLRSPDPASIPRVEIWLPAGLGPLRPAISRPERRTGSHTHAGFALGVRGGTSRLPSCLSSAPLLPFSPLWTGPLEPEGGPAAAGAHPPRGPRQHHPAPSSRTQDFLKVSSFSS
nr:collagen alpha-1(II) chain-like [Camelus dromedarius]